MEGVLLTHYFYKKYYYFLTQWSEILLITLRLILNPSCIFIENNKIRAKIGMKNI